MALTLQQKDNVSRWIHGLENPRQDLNAWELGFLASVADQFDRIEFLSEKQIDTLKKLYEEKA